MNLPFLRYFKFKKDKGSEGDGGVAVAPAPQPAAPIVKPASERFGKTVMPNVSRIVGGAPVSSFPMAMPVGHAPVTAGPRKISLGGNGSIAVAPKAEPESPAGERTIALQLADLVEQMPAGVLQSTPIDPEQRVIFKASELERGMSSGRPTVSLRSIFQQAPDFFVSDVEANDPREVVLPFGKVLEQFTAFQVRPDQVADESVPQVETPFLKMTLEDGQRFGKTSAPIPAPTPVASAEMAAALPPVEDAAPAPAPVAVAPAAPDAPKTIRPIRLSLPNDAKPSAPAASAAAPAPAAPGKISPNGIGVPATERVPASSGPPVPIPLPSPFAPAPMRVPFKVSPPSNDLRPPVAAPLPKPAAVAFSPHGPRVRLPLRNVLRGISPFQLSGPVDQVPETATIEIPYAIIEPQLSLGRIAVSPTQFQAALPEEFRALFKPEESEQPVILPLQEVLQNLPNESLQLRGDQEEIVLTETFETPFSTKAAEDAARMNVSSGPIAKAPLHGMEASVGEVVAAIAEPEPAPAAAETVAEAVPTTPATRSALQVAFETDETLDAKTIVAHTSKLPGVLACAVVFSDGLSLAGNIPAEYQTEALCALAPSIMKRINDQMVGATLGPLNGITLYCAKTPVSFFAHENICLAVLHSDGEIASDVRARLSCAARELARMYAQPA